VESATLQRGDCYLELHEGGDRGQRKGEVWSRLLEVGVADAPGHALAQDDRGQRAGGRARGPGRRPLSRPVVVVVVRVEVGSHDALLAGGHAACYMLPGQRQPQQRQLAATAAATARRARRRPLRWTTMIHT